MRQGGKSLLGYLPGHPGSWPDEVLDSIIAGLRAARAQVSAVEVLVAEMARCPGGAGCTCHAFGPRLWAVLRPGTALPLRGDSPGHEPQPPAPQAAS